VARRPSKEAYAFGSAAAEGQEGVAEAENVDWAQMKLEIQPGQRVMAVYDYSAQDGDELSFKEGDVITVLSEDIDPGWYLGELNGRQGVFPQNYVEPLQEAESRSVPEPSPSRSVPESLPAAAEEPIFPLSLSADVPSPQAASSSSAAMAKTLKLLAKPKSETAAPGR
ncbi:unnamed protein product, partial [Polarella glacialis]